MVTIRQGIQIEGNHKSEYVDSHGGGGLVPFIPLNLLHKKRPPRELRRVVIIRVNEEA